MEILLLSTLHDNAAGILKLTPQEIYVYDPITGKKKYRVVGAEYTNDLVIPGETTDVRISRVQPKGALVYDLTEDNIYIGDGVTAGGRLLTTASADANLESRVAALENAVYGIESGAVAIIDGGTAGGQPVTTGNLESRVAALENAVYGIESGAMAIIGGE